MNSRQITEMRKTITHADLTMVRHCCREISEDAFGTVNKMPDGILADILASTLTFAQARSNRWAYRVPAMVELRLDRGWTMDVAARKLIALGAKTMDAQSLQVIERKPGPREKHAQSVVHALEKVYGKTYEELTELVGQEMVAPFDGCID